MNKYILSIISLLFTVIQFSHSQYISSRGNFLEGSSYISTSRIQALKTKDKFANTISISLDYIHIEGNGYRLNDKDNYALQMNFYERNIGQTILLKCENGEVVELQTRSIQHDPFIQVYSMKPDVVEKIINGNIVKIRIQTVDGFVDREVKNNTFSTSVKKCYNLLLRTIKEDNENNKSFRKGF